MDLIAHQAIYKIQIILYYKGGASNWSYYDEDGDLLQKSADDIHRFGVGLEGIKMRILPSSGVPKSVISGMKNSMPDWNQQWHQYLQ